MITLEEAVKELHELENPREYLAEHYPNVPTITTRCMTCPVAKFLEARVGAPIWVSPDGFAKPVGSENPAYRVYFRSEFIKIIEEFDREVGR